MANDYLDAINSALALPEDRDTEPGWLIRWTGYKLYGSRLAGQMVAFNLSLDGKSGYVMQIGGRSPDWVSGPVNLPSDIILSPIRERLPMATQSLETLLAIRDRTKAALVDFLRELPVED